MPALTRRRDPDARQQKRLIFYGDVQAGSIALRSGNPNSTDLWQWHCGFYQGSRPGECTTGTASTPAALAASNWRKLADIHETILKSSFGSFKAQSRPAGDRGMADWSRRFIDPVRLPMADRCARFARYIYVEYRDELAKRMTPVQIAEAQKLAREWKPKVSRLRP